MRIIGVLDNLRLVKIQGDLCRIVDLEENQVSKPLLALSAFAHVPFEEVDRPVDLPEALQKKLLGVVENPATKHLQGKHNQKDHAGALMSKASTGFVSTTTNPSGAGLATKHLQGQHDQHTHGKGGGISFPEKFEDITPEQRMAQANYKDIQQQMAKNLSEIKREDRVSHQKVSGPLDDKSIEKIAENARAEIYGYTSYLAGDTTHLLHTFVNGVQGDLRKAAEEFKGVDAKDMDALVTDSIRKMVHQEVESVRMTYSDHGIRHIVGNIATQSQIADALAESGFPTSGRERLLAKFIQVQHDVGYTVPLVREGGMRGVQASGEHPAYSAKIAEEQRGLWNADKVFSAKEYDRAVGIIKTHQGTELDPKDPLAMSIRLADNLSLFSREKLPSAFAYVKGGKDLLVEMGLANKAGDDKAWDSARGKLASAIGGSNLNANLKRDLTASIGTINKLTPRFTLGILAGEVSSVSKGKTSLLEVRIKHNEMDSVLQANFDLGQRQVKKLLGDYGHKTYDQKQYSLGDHTGKPVLSIVVDGVD